jgi:hypothetical protein
MVSYYTAKVARGQIVIRDVDLPDGTAVTVKVEREPEKYPFRTRAQVEADLRESEAQHRRGEWVTGEESLALLRRFGALHDAGHRPSTEVTFPSRRKVARKPRNGAKPTRNRAR